MSAALIAGYGPLLLVAHLYRVIGAHYLISLARGAAARGVAGTLPPFAAALNNPYSRLPSLVLHPHSSFQLSVTTQLLWPSIEEANPALGIALSWLPQAIGGACFAIAAVIEYCHNAEATFKERIYWVSSYYPTLCSWPGLS